MTPEQKIALLDLLDQATRTPGKQHNAAVAGWHFILEHANAEYEAQGMLGKHLSARLVPPGRSSTDADWSFLGKATAVLSVPDHDQGSGALLTPFQTTPPNAVHHWHWDAPNEYVEMMRAFFNSSEYKTAATEIHGTQGAPSAPLPRPGRNDTCPCGSGKKYKHCCLGKPDLTNYGPCDGPGADGMAGQDHCGKPSCGVGGCKLCDKRYRHCHSHHEAVQRMLRGHVMRVHPETLPKSEFVKILKNPVMMNGLRQQRDLAPELWQRFFEYAA